MAKNREYKADAAAESVSEPGEVAAPESVPVGGKRWLVATTGNEPVEIVAETIEDAIRLFNGSGTSYARKQLTIVEG